MKILIPVAEGSEDMETAMLVDIFRRADAQVTLAGLTPPPIRCARGLRLVPDADWAEIDPDEFDALILPGGSGGTEIFRKHIGLQDALRRANRAGKWIGAVCAGPLALYEAGVLDSRRATLYPGLERGLPRADWREDRVVADGRILTSRGPGTCMEFALSFVSCFAGPDRARTLAADLLLRPD
ncbi:MAG: DJ-1 family glyoxalase III [Kiritimatiellia bacterium]|nr:DJ-1 family glyoxalase III [Kiritimatiellia bacterium]